MIRFILSSRSPSFYTPFMPNYFISKCIPLTVTGEHNWKLGVFRERYFVIHSDLSPDRFVMPDLIRNPVLSRIPACVGMTACAITYGALSKLGMPRNPSPGFESFHGP